MVPPSGDITADGRYRAAMAQEILLTAADGSSLNARVEMTDKGIVLHSRSGKDRNRHYRFALEMIVGRLKDAGVAYHVYLDSSPVRSQPLDERRLVFSKSVSAAAQFDAMVRAMNAGSKSHGAWRRVLITADGTDPATLGNIVQKQTGGIADDVAGNGRLPASELSKVTPAHVDRAIEQVVAGHAPLGFAPSRDFDVLAPNGARLASKKVFGAALTMARGIAATPQQFSAGLGTPCFRIVEAAGYPIICKDEVVPGGGVDPVDPDMAAAEGARQLVIHLRRERKPALAAAKKRAMIDKLGYLQCERCQLIPSKELGENGDAVIEVHHAVTQVADMNIGHVTRLADLICLCANCHRIVHRELAD